MTKSDGVRLVKADPVVDAVDEVPFAAAAGRVVPMVLMRFPSAWA